MYPDYQDKLKKIIICVYLRPIKFKMQGELLWKV